MGLNICSTSSIAALCPVAVRYAAIRFRAAATEHHLLLLDCIKSRASRITGDPVHRFSTRLSRGKCFQVFNLIPPLHFVYFRSPEIPSSSP
ncbi:hypothetical protein EVAR_7422_1 [Eumeta japonica]|uniref:Uncharacterized protein n=1 Tax=Eumeta variegata TaxID=151549 RepID=A0A4C1V6U9_EUMVA|nr:hypothetical protein EVAR_7422_1 [Eumeta japonica]